MSKPVLIAVAAAAAFAGFGLGAPASAQANQNVLVVYGDDPCPTTKSGEEIVVCARKPESERYRIPEDLRTTNPGPNDRWADRARSLETVGASGTGSCTTTGPGGSAGCWTRQMTQAREERKAAAAETRAPTDSTETGGTGIRAVLKGQD